MKKIKTFLYISIGLMFGIAFSVFAVNNFPGSMNTWEFGDTIEEGWANAIEARIGETGTTSRSSLTFQVNQLMGTTTLLELATVGRVNSTTTVSAGVSITSALNVATTTATSTFANGLHIQGGSIRLASDICSGATNGGVITTDANGNFVCENDDTGGGGSAPFPVSTFGGTVHAASSTLPFYFGQGLLTSSSTIGTLTAGIFSATSSISSAGHLSASSSISVAASSTFSNLIHVGESGDATSTFNSGILSKRSIESLGGIKSGSLTITGLTSAIPLTNAGGNFGEYAGSSCTNQFVRSLDAAGAATCATVVAGDVSLANLTATDGTLTFSGTYNGSTARTIGLNLGQANIWTALQQFNSGLTAASSTFLGNLQIQNLFASSSLFVNGSSTFQNVINVGGVNGTASSTFNTGIRLRNGCYENASGTCLTLTGATGWDIASSTLSTSTRARQLQVPFGIVITKVECNTYLNTAAIQLDERGRTTPNTAGPNVLSSALTCDTDGAFSTTFTNNTLEQDDWLNLQITDAQPGVARPTMLTVIIHYIKDAP